MLKTLDEIEEVWHYWNREYTQRDTQGVDEIYKFLCNPHRQGSILWHFKAVQESGEIKRVYNETAVNYVLERLNEIHKMRWTIEFYRTDLQLSEHSFAMLELKRTSSQLADLYRSLQTPNAKPPTFLDQWLPRISDQLRRVEALAQQERRR